MKLAVLIICLAVFGCSSSPTPTTMPTSTSSAVQTQQATFAAGCFWGVQAAFDKLPGVVSTTAGYTGGHTQNPTYRQVCNHDTGHAEAVLVTFDPTRISYPELLDAFWSSHDPTTLNRQGPDVGDQYRSAIFFHTPEQEQQARESLKEVEDAHVFKRKIVTEITPASRFYPAEDYHQEYLQKQGTAATCHVGVAQVHTNLAKQAAAARLSPSPGTPGEGTSPLSPRERAGVRANDGNLPSSKHLSPSPGTPGEGRGEGSFGTPTAYASCSPTNPQSACGSAPWTDLTDDQLRAKLTPDQYRIARQAGTERAFTGKYWNDHRPGIYRCAVCGQELFNANTKFDSGTGWPSFYQPINKSAVVEKSDTAHGMTRTEVLCSRCRSHLGHVFDDGPAPTGLRYCMNSAVLDLVPDAKPQSASK